MREEITIQIRGDRVSRSARGGSREAPAALAALVESLGGRVRPLHPDASDATLASYFVVEAETPEARDRLLETLRASELVQAAYVKPLAEPP